MSRLYTIMVFAPVGSDLETNAEAVHNELNDRPKFSELIFDGYQVRTDSEARKRFAVGSGAAIVWLRHRAGGSWYSITRLEGQRSIQEIMTMYGRVLRGEFDRVRPDRNSENGEGKQTNKDTSPGKPKKGLFTGSGVGLGLFGFPFWLLGIIAAAAAYRKKKNTR